MDQPARPARGDHSLNPARRCLKQVDRFRRRCSAQHFCGHLGHFYDLWQPCTSRGHLPAHATTGCPLIRACIYCGHHDLALLANLPTH